MTDLDRLNKRRERLRQRLDRLLANRETPADDIMRATEQLEAVEDQIRQGRHLIHFD